MLQTILPGVALAQITCVQNGYRCLQFFEFHNQDNIFEHDDCTRHDVYQHSNTRVHILDAKNNIICLVQFSKKNTTKHGTKAGNAP